MNIIWKGANPNNYMVGRQGTPITGLVLHWVVGTLESADATFQNPDRRASATYGIGDDEIHQYVREEDTAYANGNWDWNLKAISIEHEGGPDIPITEATYETSAQLVADICSRYAIPLDRDHIKRHREVSSTVTSCPGTLDIDRIIARAQQLQGGTEVTQEAHDQAMNDLRREYERIMVRMCTKEIAHDPSYETDLPEAFQHHCDYIKDNLNGELTVCHDFLDAYDWHQGQPNIQEARKSLQEALGYLGGD